MANNYFDFLEQNSVESHPESGNINEEMVNLTVRADAECQVVCDGDFLFLLPPNQIIKEKAPVGQHILQFISTEYPDVVVEKVVDFPEVGKNYLVIVNDLQALLANRIKKAAEEKAEAESKARAEAEEARIKAEAETIVSVEFVSKVDGKGTYTGHLKDGKPEGKGKVVFESGTIYEGDFQNGSIHGTGLYRKSDGWLYEGEFKEDNYNGKGKLTAPDGRVWEGEFLNGWSHGKTKLLFSNGDILEGTWENGNVANKPVVYIWESGERLECKGYSNGLNGRVIHYYLDGRFVEELWKDGHKDEDAICFVDLGLSVMWATKNVAIKKPIDLGAGPKVVGEEYGPMYYMNKYKDKDSFYFYDPMSKCSFVEGNGMRLPTLDEIKELLNDCDWEKQRDCYKVKSRVNANYINIFRQDSGISIDYWSSTPDDAVKNHVLALGDEITLSVRLRESAACKIRLVK